MSGQETMAAIYSIAPGDKPDTLALNEVGKQTIKGGYASLTSTRIRDSIYLFGYNPSENHLDVYEFTETSPWLKLLDVKPAIGSGADIINTFILGNQPYLAVYTAGTGIFEIYKIKEDFTNSKPYQFYRNHELAISQGFTTVKTFTQFGQVVFLGYNGTNGYVAMYTVGVTAFSAEPDVPPVVMTPAWSHQWAKGWTRFAFFQLGGENFFLKTNTWKPNVNIDHVLDALSAGTVEVGTRLSLRAAQELNNVESFVLGNGDPYFVTYISKSGDVTLNRFNSDCLGWITVGPVAERPDVMAQATNVVPLSTARRQTFLVFA
jgi:hypothetical protein